MPSLSYTHLGFTELQEYHAEAFRSRPADFGADVRAFLTVPAPTAQEVATALRRLRSGTAAFRMVLEEVDVLVTPTVPIPAARLGEETAVLPTVTRFTAPFNATQLPALSVPCGFTTAGLPIGLQIAGRPFDEATILRVGHAYEQATEWHQRRPELAIP